MKNRKQIDTLDSRVMGEKLALKQEVSDEILGPNKIEVVEMYESLTQIYKEEHGSCKQYLGTDQYKPCMLVRYNHVLNQIDDYVSVQILNKYAKRLCE